MDQQNPSAGFHLAGSVIVADRIADDPRLCLFIFHVVTDDLDGWRIDAASFLQHIGNIHEKVEVLVHTKRFAEPRTQGSAQMDLPSRRGSPQFDHVHPFRPFRADGHIASVVAWEERPVIFQQIRAFNLGEIGRVVFFPSGNRCTIPCSDYKEHRHPKKNPDPKPA